MGRLPISKRPVSSRLEIAANVAVTFPFPPYPLPMPGRATLARGRVPVISRYESPGYA